MKKIKNMKEYIIRNEVNIIVVLVILIASIILMIGMDHVLMLDEYVKDNMTMYRDMQYKDTMLILTDVISVYIPIALSAIFLVLGIKNKEYLNIPFNLGLATALNIVIKEIVKRPRQLEGIKEFFGYSFPSRTCHGSYNFLWTINILTYETCKELTY